MAQAPMNEHSLITKEQFESVDVEKPIRASCHVDCTTLANLFRDAWKREKDENQVSATVFGFLMSVCDIHLGPRNNDAPYVEKFSSPEWRTMRPEDIRGEQSLVLSEIAASIENHGLRARLADIVWYNDRSQADMATCAIDAYCLALCKVLDGKAALFLDEEGAIGSDGLDMLYRACQIANGIGRKQEHTSRLAALALGAVNNSIAHEHYGSLAYAVDLVLQFRLENAGNIASMIEETINSKSLDGHLERDLWECAAIAYKTDGSDDDHYRCMVRAAESYVKLADAAKGDGILESSFLRNAITSLMALPDTKARRTELESRLSDSKVTILDQMKSITTVVDVSDLVKFGKDAVRGGTLASAIKNFVLLAGSPDPDELREHAQDSAEKFPLSNMLSLDIHDLEGNVVASSPGYMPGGENQEIGLRHIVIRHEQIRRQSLAFGMIDPARLQIRSEHPISDVSFRFIAEMSPFVPIDRSGIFSSGFTRFLHGDYISASHILVPQLENSLRYILEQYGEQTSVIRRDATQERIMLSSILKNSVLRDVLGSAIIYELENLFDFRGGPSLRHQFAHGLVSTNACFESDVIYACWFIFRLTCIPILPNWNDVEQAMTQQA